jgi:flagellar motor switch protein FliN/FliY
VSEMNPTTEHVAKAAEFTPIQPTDNSTTEANLETLADIPITMTARLGRVTLTIGDILKLGPGSTVNLDREVQQPIDLIVGDKVFARGEVLVIDERFAIRIKEVIRPGGDRR